MDQYMAKTKSSQSAAGKKGRPAPRQSGSNGPKKKAPAAERPRSAAAVRYQQEEERRLQRNNQFFAIVLFAVGIFFCTVSLIDGPKLWGWLHDGLRGICGPISYGIGPLLIYIAVMVTLEKDHMEVHNRVWQMLGMLVLLCGIAQLFYGEPAGEGFINQLVGLWQDGVELRSGGLLAGLLCWPMLVLLGRTGTIIIHALLAFVFLMLISGSTLMGLFKGVAKPVKQIEETYVRHRERREIEEEEAEARSQDFEFDLPLEGGVRPPRRKAAPAPASASAGENLSSAIDRFMESPDEAARRGRRQPEPAQLEPAHLEPAQQKPAQLEPEVPEEEPFLPDPSAFLRPELDFEPDEAAFEAFMRPSAEEAPGPAEEEPVPVSEPLNSGDAPLDEMINRAINEFRRPEPPAAPESGPAAGAGAEFPAAPLPQAAPSQGAPAAFRPQTEPPYAFPPVSLLNPPKASNSADSGEELRANAAKLVETLKSFGVQTKVIDICRGPTVTRYELQPSAGVKISKITGLADDIALNLATAGVRIEAPIPNKPAVGIEVPNRVVDMVSIRELIDSDEFRTAKGVLPAVLGRDIAGSITIGDIAAMPHVLVAGTTGSGKSVCVNSIIISLLYKFSPKELRLIMIDPKMVELVVYNGIPHLLIPVVTDPKKAAGALGWAVNEMLKRYNTFSENGVRDIKGYNRMAEGEGLPHMPHMVIVIDELSDLMMAAPNEVEDAICRLAQMARAAGMYLIIATQRPSVDVVTGLIKANIPSRIALTVSSQVDSRTIIDTAGAEKLLGKGDMLYYPVGFPKPLRVQGCFVSDGEVEAVVKYIKEGQQQAVEYDAEIMEEIERQAAADSGKKGERAAGGEDESDPLFNEAVGVVLDAGQASTSYLQRRLKVGYARAARLMDELEERGIVGPQDGSKPRELTITRAQWNAMSGEG